jgi:hypothetical protein
MSWILFGQGAPESRQEMDALFERMESAAGNDLITLKEALAEISDQNLSNLASGLINYNGSGVVLRLIVESLLPQIEFTNGQLSQLLSVACKYYSNDAIERSEFEVLFNNIVNHSRPEPDSIIPIIQNAIYTTFSDADAKLKLESESLEFIDSWIAKSIAEYPECLTTQNFHRSHFGLLISFNLPKMLGSIVSGYNVLGHSLPQASIASIYYNDALNKEYINILSSGANKNLFLKACSEANLNTISLNSAKNFMEVFGESALFPEASLTELKMSLSSEHFPYFLNILKHKDFDAKKMPILSSFLMDNADLIYAKFEDHFNDIRCGLLRVFKEFGRLEDVIKNDVYYLRDKGILPQGNFTLAQTLFELKFSESPQYHEGLATVSTIGIIESEPFIRGVNNAVLRDIFNVVDLSGISQKEMFNIYPTSKGLFLEDELGL